uniref:C2H2-type domain-containing protein n=1 Tax=Anopheles christyi TaxID=43041 RepID=A0A182K751_9DIPT
VCRLCLCDDPTFLIPASEVISESLSLQDVEWFTSVQITPVECTSCAICVDCGDKLNNAVAFYDFCKANDAQYGQMQNEHVQSAPEDHSGSVRASSKASMYGKAREKEKLCTSDGKIETLDSMTDEGNSCDNGGSSSDEISHNNERETEETQLNNVTQDLAVEYCDEISSSSSSQHRPETEVECTICAIKLVNETAYNKHYRRYHLSDSEKNRIHRKKRQMCVICGAMVLQLSTHSLIHKQEKDLACPHCPMRMKSKGNLSRHIQAVHLKTASKTCEICDKGFVHANVYKYHMLSVHGIGKTYDCDICLKKFKAITTLKSHKAQVHSNLTKFECVTCGKLLKTRHNLRMHEKQVHNDEKLYTCSQCPKRFKTLPGKTNHELAHKGVVFPCLFCEEVFRYKSLLQGHVKKDHEDMEQTSVMK